MSDTLTHQPGLARLLTQVAGGEVPPGEAEARLQGSLGALEETRRSLQDSIDSLPPGAREQCQMAVQTALHRLEDYRQLLERVHSQVGQSSAEQLEDFAQEVVRRAREVDLALISLREETLAAWGPTGLPGVNLVLRTLEEFRQGESPLEVLAEDLESEARRLEGSLQDSQLSRSERAASERLLQAMLAGLEGLSAEGVELDPIREEILQAAQAFEQLLKDSQAAGQGPSWLPRLNRALHAARRSEQGGLEVDEAAEHIAEARQELEGFRQRVADARGQSEPGMAADSLAGLESLVEEMEQLLEQLAQGLGAEAGEEARAGREGLERRLVDRARALDQLRLQLEQAAQREGRLPCIRCGHLNPGDRKTCESCGSILPRSEQEASHQVDLSDESGSAEQASPPLDSFENLEQALAALHEFQEGNLNRDDYLEALSALSTLVERARYLVPRPEADSPEASEAPGAYHAGLDRMQRGLEALAAIQDPREPVSEAVEELRSGAALLARMRGGADPEPSA